MFRLPSRLPLCLPSLPLRRLSHALALTGLLTTPLLAGAQEAPVARLSDVVVTASGFEQDVAEAPASITVITREALEGKFYRDVTDALQDVPGVSIEGGAGGKIESTSVTIRGMSENYVLFLVDGKPLGASSEAYYNGFGGGAQVGWLPPLSAIERIEVIRGPMSSLYGSSALGGVINIITRKVGETWTGNVTVDGIVQSDKDAGNANQVRYYLSGPLVAGRLGLTLNGSRYHRDEDHIINGYAGKTRVDNTARLDWRLTDDQSLQFEAGLARHDNVRTVDNTGADSDMANRRVHWGVTHDVRWGNASTQSFGTHEAVRITNGSYASEYRASVLNTKTVLPLGAHRLTLGGEYKHEKTLHDGSRFPGSRSINLSRWQAALFLEDEYFLTEDFALTGGLRLDRNQNYGSRITPRLYGVYHLNPSWVLKGGVGGGYKTPSLKQADDAIVEIAARGAAWDMGNKDLQPERSTNYEIGLTWTGVPQESASLTAYYTRFRDKISTQTICQSPAVAPACEYNGEIRQRINQYINLDAATLRGIEASYAVPLGPVQLKTSYTFSHSEVTSGNSAGRPLNDMPRHMANLGLDWRATERLGLWGKVRYKSRTIEDGTSQRPAYTLVDLGATYQVHRHVQLFGGVYNAFNKEISVAEYGKTLDGRRYYLGASVSF